MAGPSTPDSPSKKPPVPWLNAKRAANGRRVKENFADWFEDSKVVDESGSPLVVYHGTHIEFDAFDPEKSFRGIGFQFAGEKETGEFYAHGHEDGRVLACFLKMKNPYVLDLDERAQEVDGEKTEDELSGGDYYPNVPVDWFHKEGRNEIREAIVSQGYDGYILKGAGETLYGVISPLQIKSVDNCGLFLKDSPSITDACAQKDLILKAMKALREASGVELDAEQQAALEASLEPKVARKPSVDSPFGQVEMALPLFIDSARPFSDQYPVGHPGHAKVDDLAWVMVSDYPVARLKDAPSLEWFEAEQKAWAKAGELRRFNDMLTEPISSPIVVKDDGQGGFTWDGNHRVGASLKAERTTIPALVGMKPELLHLFLPAAAPHFDANPVCASSKKKKSPRPM